MAFTVETGTGLLNANSYASVAEADAYFFERDVSVWAAMTQVQKEAALINATDYINIVYGPRICGKPLSVDQSMIFPTTAFKDVPVGVKRATFELAIYSQSEDLFIRSKPDASQNIASIEKTVGPLTVDTTYRDTSGEPIRIKTIDMIFRLFYRSNQGGVYR